jgi:membrane-bound ClpP family serine protease
MTLIVSLLILAGLALLVVEVIFIPGTTVVGIIGLVLALAGIGFSYWAFGSTIGFYTLISTLAGLGLLLYFSFRSGAWNKFANKNTISSKFNEGLNESFSVGEEGISVSVLRPMGKAEFNSRVVEVSSLDGYIESGVRVRIKEVSQGGISVEPIA